METCTGNTMSVRTVMLAFVSFLYGLDVTLSQNHEVWRSTRMVKSACELEEKFRQTGQFPEPIKDQQGKDYCGWFSKGKPRGDACADIRLHFSSCKDESTAKHASVRVINGTNARMVFPSIASFWHCSGSVINNRWLLTAAHCLCFIPIPKPTRALGMYYVEFRDNGSNPFRIDVKTEKRICHENYTKYDIRYDIGVSKVSEFEYNEGVQPIVMPPSKDFRYMGPAYFVGYGLNNSDPGEAPSFLQEVTLPVLSIKICQDYFAGDITDDRHICAGYFDSGKRTCSGDSGGPLFICQNYRLIQYGHLLGGSEACGDTPSLFVRLSHYADWISKTIADN